MALPCRRRLCRRRTGIHPKQPLRAAEENGLAYQRCWMITSETCDRCGITYAAHFDHPQLCPASMADEVDHQAAEEPAAWRTSSAQWMMDVDQAAKAMREEEMHAEIEDFLECFNQPTFSGMRFNGQGVATWSSKNGWSGDSRPDAEWLQ